MKKIISYKLFEDSYNNKFIGNSDKSTWDENDIRILDYLEVETFNKYEIDMIEKSYINRFSNREDILLDIKKMKIFSNSIDKIRIDIYIKIKNRKKPILNSTTFITKLSDEYFWIELRNVLTNNSYNFKCDSLAGLIEVIEKL